MGVVRAVAAAGGVVVGPVARVASALSLVNGPLDIAVLDLNLRGESSLPVAEALLSRGIPIVFATGYDTAFMPEPLRGAPVLHKPITDAALVEAVARALRV
jgi:CheY-like chemotaxis protein